MKDDFKQLIELNSKADKLRNEIYRKLAKWRGDDKDVTWDEDQETLCVGLTMDDGTFITVKFSLKCRIVRYSHEMSAQEKEQFYRVFDEVMAS